MDISNWNKHYDLSYIWCNDILNSFVLLMYFDKLLDTTLDFSCIPLIMMTVTVTVTISSHWKFTESLSSVIEEIQEVPNICDIFKFNDMWLPLIMMT